MARSFDAIVIGAGQAGPSLTARLAGAGMKTAIVERHLVGGGTCVNTGCTPAKTMVVSAYASHLARRAGDCGVAIEGRVGVDMARVKAREDEIASASRRNNETWSAGIEGLMLVREHARFVGPCEIDVAVTPPSQDRKKRPMRHVLRSDDPIFQSVLGADWARLGDIVRKHYSLRPFSRDAVTVRGAMTEVWHSRVAKVLLPMARLAGALVPYRGREVPIEVHYSARHDDSTLHWNRVFHFPGRAPVHFRSHMELADGNEVIEFVRLGIGMRLAVTAEEGALVFRGRGYVWRVLGRDCVSGHMVCKRSDAKSFRIQWFLALLRTVGLKCCGEVRG